MARTAIYDYGTSQLLQDLDKRKQKRQYNHTAQRTYRRSQKQRTHALEAAVMQSAKALSPRETMLLDEVLCEPAVSPSDNGVWAIDPILTDNSPSFSADMARADITKQNGKGNTALYLAAETGGRNLLQILLEKLADPDVMNSLACTALFATLLSENETTVVLLLKPSTNVNAKDSIGNVALHIAVECVSKPMVFLLLAYGADIDA
ncbi:ankyrin [Colletotrichum sublineola]|nr:ankyrin [Colletotrichum sublineola]